MATINDIQNLFSAWNLALKTGDTSEVLKLYAENAILLPTLSPIVRHNHEEIGNYFEFFLGLSPSARMQQENIRIFGDIAVNSGIYVFTVTQNGKTTDIPVRFSFVYKLFDDRWLIVEHHSSALPA